MHFEKQIGLFQGCSTFYQSLHLEQIVTWCAWAGKSKNSIALVMFLVVLGGILLLIVWVAYRKWLPVWKKKIFPSKNEEQV